MIFQINCTKKISDDEYHIVDFFHVTHYVAKPESYGPLAPGIGYVMCDVFGDVKKSTVGPLHHQDLFIYLFIHLIIYLCDYLLIYKLYILSIEISLYHCTLLLDDLEVFIIFKAVIILPFSLIWGLINTTRLDEGRNQRYRFLIKPYLI